ncbi:dentin sialophosphoprotein-like [Palaemon carinicauda]|uniref:dentin sialophosphoprotein-like n=1 Tax=Palaemon carinicauda TaxID=392227 RepID=UPI0035B69BA9
MSDSEDNSIIPSTASADYSDDDGPSTSWGLKRRNKCSIISDSENDDDEDLGEEVVKDDGESGESDSSDDTPGARTCAICLGRMRGEVGSPDACEHTFCKFCLLEWAKTNPTCPQDRIPFTVVLVRKVLGGPISKEIPIPKGPAPDVYEFVETENPTYCEVCNQCDREERLLLCDGCDLGYHLECLDPPLQQVPVEEWFCPVCVAVDVPETLSSRISSSSRRLERARRLSSRSGAIPHEQQELRIPRTRATERIRQHIQKKKNKKKLKRRKQKERKRARISSGELEDTRAPVTQFGHLKYFIEGDNDIDAEHTEDRYADQLLAGATHDAARLPSQRKADAARRLRDVAFTPHASYSGRVKNKVLEIVNTQSEETDKDLLSDILEKQTIAFSSSKKLLLTNDRKLVKQPNAQFSCDVIQETNSLMSEPLPSQRKSPDKEVLASCSNEDSSLDTPKELQKEDSHDDKPCTSSERKRSPSRSLHCSSSSSRERHGSNYEHKHNHKRTSEWDKEGDHSKSRYKHNHSKYSHHDRYHSSHYEPSCSSNRKDRNWDSSRWKDKRDHRSYHNRYDSHAKHSRELSPHRRNRSHRWENRRDRSSPASSHDRKSDSSRSRSPHSRLKGESSHLLGRSLWSYDYFNSNDNIISKSNSIGKNDPLPPGTEELSNSKNSKPENNSTTECLNNIADEVSSHCVADSLQKKNPQGSMAHPELTSEVEGQNLEKPLTAVNEVLASKPKQIFSNGEPSKEGKLDESYIEENQNEGSFTEITKVSKENKLNKNKCNVGEISDDSQRRRTGMSSIKLPIFKKTKFSELFGDLKKEENINKKRNVCKMDVEKERELEEKPMKYSKGPKKSKSELLFGYDSDSNSNSEDILGERQETSKYKSSKIHTKDTSDNEHNNSSHSKRLMNEVSKSEAEEYNPVRASSEKYCKGKESVSWTKHISEEKEIKVGADSQRKHNKESEGRELKKNDTKANEYCSKTDGKGMEGKQSRKHVVRSKELVNEEKYDNKCISKMESHSFDCDKLLGREEEIKLNDKYITSKHELDPLLKEVHSTKGRNLKPSDKISDIANARKNSNTNIHKMSDTEVKEVESHNSKCQGMESRSHSSEKSVLQKIDVTYEKQNSKIKESDLCGKFQIKEKEEKAHKSNSERELYVQERYHLKKTKHGDNLDKNGKVEIPEKYKSKLSLLENLIGKDIDTDYWEMDTFENENFVKFDSSKNNGVGRKSSSKGSFLFDKKMEENGDCIAFKGSDNKDDSFSKCKDVKLENLKVNDAELKTDRKAKVNQDFSKGKKQKDSHALSDLFGDIDDIGSSSCSNLPETEFEDQPQNVWSNTSPKGSLKDEQKSISFEKEIGKPKDSRSDVIPGGCDNTSVLMQEGKPIGDEADDRGLAMFRCAPISKDKANSVIKSDGVRIKQQKAVLEARVVEEVKKSLDPFYRSKAITKDEYKQIVAKCVKKVVKAECGDDIEPEKMRSLVLGYIKVYKHRQMKLHE